VTAGTVSASTPVTVTGSYNSSSQQGSVTVLPPQIVLTSFERDRYQQRRSHGDAERGGAFGWRRGYTEQQ
jgi:hypothetical protein